MRLIALNTTSELLDRPEATILPPLFEADTVLQTPSLQSLEPKNSSNQVRPTPIDNVIFQMLCEKFATLTFVLQQETIEQTEMDQYWLCRICGAIVSDRMKVLDVI
jgi:hypothetical protein